MENIEEAKKALETARWKTEGLYNLHAAGMKPGETNGHMVLCVDIVEEIDKAANILAHVARATGSRVLPGCFDDEGLRSSKFSQAQT